jgi:RimJ/RimL family protein N-acetyltransferase
MVSLETDRLTLRMFRESDFDAYAEMCADLEVMRYIGDGHPLSRSNAVLRTAAKQRFRTEPETARESFVPLRG